MKIKTPKREVKSFQNKYLALTIISLLFFATSQAQFIKPNNSYGTTSNGQNIERVLFFPTGCGPDTLNLIDSAINKYAIYGDSCNNKVYFYNPKTKTWNTIGASASDITGLISAGSNITITGTGTSADPYVINSTGGSDNTKYLIQGYGTKIDSSGANYTVAIDTTLIKDSLYAGKGIKVDTTTYPNHSFVIVDSQYVRDTSLNLRGGTTGQVLKKNSTANGDWSWQDESGGGITGNYIDTTTAPTDSTIRFHFVQGNYVDYIIRAPQIDTSHLSDRINANAANIATNTSAIAANTTAIAGKADKVTTITINGVTYDLSANRTWTISTGSVADTFRTITSNNLGYGISTNYHFQNAGLVIRDTVPNVSGSGNTPPIILEGRQNGLKFFWRLFGDGSVSNGKLNLQYSTDSINWNTPITWDRNGAYNVGSISTGTVNVSQIGGTKFSFFGTNGTGILGANRTINPNAVLELVGTDKGVIVPQMTTDQRQTITGSVRRGTILTGGSGYSVGGTLAPTGGHGVGQTLNITVTGGVVTAVSASLNTGKNYRVGDVLSWDGSGGTGFTYRVDAITGDTSKNLMVSDTTTGQIMTWNGVSYQGEEIQTSASTWDILTGQDIVFSGTTSTFTLPAPTISRIGRQNRIIIMNLGSGSITVNSNAGSTIMPKGSSTAASTVTIVSGASAELYPTGTYFKVLYNN